MDSNQTTFRAVFRATVTAGLIASLGFAGICPHAADGARGRLPRQASHTSHNCPCVLNTGHCSCGSACQCGQRLPQKDNEPAAPNRSNDRGQPLGIAADAASFSGTTAVAIQALGCPAHLTGGSTSLLTLGTRLNC
jgi:hypothetical protein